MTRYHQQSFPEWREPIQELEEIPPPSLLILFEYFDYPHHCPVTTVNQRIYIRNLKWTLFSDPREMQKNHYKRISHGGSGSLPDIEYNIWLEPPSCNDAAGATISNILIRTAAQCALEHSIVCHPEETLLFNEKMLRFFKYYRVSGNGYKK